MLASISRCEGVTVRLRPDAVRSCRNSRRCSGLRSRNRITSLYVKLPVVISSARTRSPIFSSSSPRLAPLDVCTVVSAVKQPPDLAACDDSAEGK